MSERTAYLAMAKQRAHQRVKRGDLTGAAESMMGDLGRYDGCDGWQGDKLFLKFAYMNAILFRTTPARMREWIEAWG